MGGRASSPAVGLGPRATTLVDASKAKKRCGEAQRIGGFEQGMGADACLKDRGPGGLRLPILYQRRDVARIDIGNLGQRRRPQWLAAALGDNLGELLAEARLKDRDGLIIHTRFAV